MKYFVTYCPYCNKKTKHLFIQKDQNISERLVLGLFTFGFNEMFVNKMGECVICKNINKNN